MTAPAKTNSKLLPALLALIGVLVVGVGLVYQFLTPITYRASARIKVLKRVVGQNQSSATAQNAYDPDLALAECQVVRSNAFLDRAIQDLGLFQSWGKRYHQGIALGADEARERLLSQLDVHPLPNSSVLAIDVSSEDSSEPARIANELARLYLDYRQSQPRNAFHGKIGSLQQEWDVQHKKVQDAQVKLAQAATNVYFRKGIRVYDPASADYQKLKAHRIECEARVVQMRDELKELKSAQPAELRQVLSSLDPSTNSMLNIALRQWRKARNDLVDAESGHGPDSPEVKDARLVVNSLETNLDGIVNTIMRLKQAELDSQKASLKQFDEDLKHTRLFGQPDPTLFEDATYVQAFRELQQTKRDLDALEKMDSAYPDEALMPVVINAELMDEAEAPSRPSAPSRRITTGIISAGTLLVLIAFAPMIASQKRKPAPRKA